MDTGVDARLALLISRRSVAPKRLAGPGPSAAEIDAMLAAALRAPDHGRLTPWRVIAFAAAQRPALADLFEAEKRRRDPLMSDDDIARARGHATVPPALLAFVVCPRRTSAVPMREQWLAAGAALGNLLNAAHALGYGAIMLSGDRCHDAALTGALGITGDEVLAGFVSIGRIAKLPPPAESPDPAAVLTSWRGPPEPSSTPENATTPGLPGSS
ncbi:MAG: nitroreductase [Proteobacteria bacterium]|nr:nitroreductase [Pseudomonadota bacterium]